MAWAAHQGLKPFTMFQQLEACQAHLYKNGPLSQRIVLPTVRSAHRSLLPKKEKTLSAVPPLFHSPKMKKSSHTGKTDCHLSKKPGIQGATGGGNVQRRNGWCGPGYD
jgi:hypothetical protein